MNNHHIIDENDFMSIIHANVVNQCLDFMSILSDGIEHIETEPMGDTLDMYSPVINSESTYVFKERDINLFKALEAWCEKTRFYKNYAGVTCFDRVWEWVNDSVWGNIEHPESDNPIYHIGNTDYEGKGDAIPDTIRIEKDIEDKCTTYIFDSTYYTIDKTYPQKGKEEKKIVGFPSNSDIVKQVAYLKLIKSQYGEGDYFNSFLLPEYHERCSSDEKELLIVPESDWFRRIGYVLPGKFSLPISPKTKQDGEEEKVGLVFVDPDKLYDRYLKGYHASDEELKRTTAPMLL